LEKGQKGKAHERLVGTDERFEQVLTGKQGHESLLLRKKKDNETTKRQDLLHRSALRTAQDCFRGQEKKDGPFVRGGWHKVMGQRKIRKKTVLLRSLEKIL